MKNKISYKTGDYVLNNKNTVVYLNSKISNKINVDLFVQVDSSGISNLIYDYKITRKATDKEIEKFKLDKNSHIFNLL